MEFFESITLSSRRPELLPDESILIQQGQVGLYDGKQKIENYQDGTCYLTTHRIVYVDNISPLERSIGLSLSLVQHVDSYNGFLRSSPKIMLDIRQDVQTDAPQNNSANSNKQGVWACPICFFSNKASFDKCELCGVRNENVENTVISTDTTAMDGSTCTVCTFQNHPSMVQCEMCGADLPRETLPTPNSDLQTTQSGQIRLSFRRGGQASFLAKLKVALGTRQWEKVKQAPSTPKVRGVGINAIEDRIQKTTLEANETMTDAFQDLDRLMAKATEMVKLAESISSKVSKDSANNEDGEISTLRTHLLSLGIVSPVTKGTAGSIYHQELSKELADFLGRFFEDRDNTKSLTDVYCLFNRARGTALISPEDLYKASQQFEPLKLPFRLRKFDSGLLVIQSIDMNDHRAANRILKHIIGQGGIITAIKLAEIEEWALPVATEQLLMTERLGFICRDEGPAGLNFYQNLFLNNPVA